MTSDPTLTTARPMASNATPPAPSPPTETVEAPTPAWTVDGAFAVAAALRTEAPAVVCADVTLTYGDLDQRSDHVSAHLQAHGMAEGDICAIDCRSLADFTIAALGVLKEWEGIEMNVGEINRRYEAKAMQLLDATNSRYLHVSLSETLVITASSGLWAAGRTDCCCCCWKHFSVSPAFPSEQVSGAHPQVPR